jgi:hypothetical protein
MLSLYRRMSRVWKMQGGEWRRSRIVERVPLIAMVHTKRVGFRWVIMVVSARIELEREEDYMQASRKHI